ncbi:hypothetical protein Tco_0221903 [Tanacetum coccineum]|uniref:Uncharacterized protein n=1 Tax=Tanacetum coccineum TaxID=301880 RepID=A0ABQ5AB49_9ASTR
MDDLGPSVSRLCGFEMNAHRPEETFSTGTSFGRCGLRGADCWHGVVLLRIRASVSLRLVDHRGSLLENFLVFHPWIVKKVVKLYLIE